MIEPVGIYVTVAPEDLPPALAERYRLTQVDRRQRGEPPAEYVRFRAADDEVEVLVALDERLRGRCGTLVGPDREIGRHLSRSRERPA